MAGITWWTQPRRGALAEVLGEGASFREAAQLLSVRFRRHVTADAVDSAARRFGFHGHGRPGRPPKRPHPASHAKT